MTDAKPALNHQKLKRWFVAEARDFPWRRDPTPYEVWISEMMLQQTQAAVVVPYFERWMTCFPTVQHVAQAELHEVLKEWEGLGYYSRARYIHEAALYLVEHCNGVFPSTEEGLKKIKGLGPYTIGAIRSFAFHQRAAAVDGNVLRVLARYLKVEEDISQPKTVQKLRQMAQELLPEEESWIANEALIELGATYCGRKPKCALCPLRAECLGHRSGMAQQLPIKSKKQQVEALYRAVALVRSGDYVLVRQGAKGEIMSDLYEFPYFETGNAGWTVEEFRERLLREWGFAVSECGIYPEVKHSFTRYRVTLRAVNFVCDGRHEVAGLQWLTVPELKRYAFSSGHRRLFQLLLS